MIGWNDYMMKQEQYRDQLREAEKQRLIKQATGDCKSSLIQQAIRNLLARLSRRELAQDQVPCGGQTRLAGKAV